MCPLTNALVNCRVVAEQPANRQYREAKRRRLGYARHGVESAHVQTPTAAARQRLDEEPCVGQIGDAVQAQVSVGERRQVADANVVDTLLIQPAGDEVIDIVLVE